MCVNDWVVNGPPTSLNGVQISPLPQNITQKFTRSKLRDWIKFRTSQSFNKSFRTCCFSQSKVRRSVTTSFSKQSVILEAKGIGALMPSMSVAVPYYTASLALLLVFAVLRFLFCTLLFRKLVVRLFIKFAGAELSKEVFGESLFGWEMYKAVTTTLMTDLQKKAKRGLEAPNPPLFSADGQSRSHLLDFARESRPLVVNFGSCTCPVFMERLREFNDVMTEFSDIADFLVIYISEAHPTDGWAFKVIISCICREVECFVS